MEKYNLHNRRDIPKEYECCWNCRYMAWQVGIGMGVRCTNIKNQYSALSPEERAVVMYLFAIHENPILGAKYACSMRFGGLKEFRR